MEKILSLHCITLRMTINYDMKGVGDGDVLAAEPPKHLHHQPTPKVIVIPISSQTSEESLPSLVDTNMKKYKIII